MRRRRGVFGLVMVGTWCSTSVLAGSGGAAVRTRPPDKVVARISSAPVFARTLRNGDLGADVKALQRWLSDLGYRVPVTGDFGPRTRSAVRRFQLSHRVYPADGSVGNRAAAILRATAPDGGPVRKAHINPDGTATAPADAPAAVKAVIAAANQIIDRPYVYGGGHGSWISAGYDCSGAVSYALHGGGLLSAPLAGEFEGYGLPGHGRWITVYANSQHVFAAIAGLGFDTADFGGPNIPAGSGPRWRFDPTGNLADGGNYIVRHPDGL
jgi:peptidoglycan hydrolase-like protein with peptidoglycan-binding domain